MGDFQIRKDVMLQDYGAQDDDNGIITDIIKIRINCIAHCDKA